MKRVSLLFFLGKDRYNLGDEVLLAGLRTITHILDKGRQSDLWASGHGADAYEGCVKLMERLADSPLSHDPSYQWAKDKVLEYKNAQKTGHIERAVYVAMHNDVKTRELLCDIIKSRRFVRSFIDRRVESEVLKKPIDVVNWAPVSCNRQPIVLYVTQKKELVEGCLKQCAGVTCFSEIVPPCFIAVCVNLQFYSLIDRHVSIIDGALGIQNFLLLAHTYGMEGTVLNWMHATQREDRMLRKLLDIPKYRKIIFNLALGYPKNAASFG